ncbi:MAG: urease accessory protein [Rhodospirillaceae bacterium]|nr:MAG: urease accessory protein [Rhodospirillaceae bacterium]
MRKSGLSMALMTVPTLLVVPTAAYAHASLMGGGLGEGFVHPFTGLDHMLAMLTIGLWAGQRPMRGGIIIAAIRSLPAWWPGLSWPWQACHCRWWKGGSPSQF